MRVYLTMGPDGRILVQARIETQDGVLGHLLHYISQGDTFIGVDFNALAQATPGAYDVPDQPDGSNVEPDTSGLEGEQGAEGQQ